MASSPGLKRPLQRLQTPVGRLRPALCGLRDEADSQNQNVAPASPGTLGTELGARRRRSIKHSWARTIRMDPWSMDLSASPPRRHVRPPGGTRALGGTPHARPIRSGETNFCLYVTGRPSPLEHVATSGPAVALLHTVQYVRPKLLCWDWRTHASVSLWLCACREAALSLFAPSAFLVRVERGQETIAPRPARHEIAACRWPMVPYVQAPPRGWTLDRGRNVLESWGKDRKVEGGAGDAAWAATRRPDKETSSYPASRIMRAYWGCRRTRTRTVDRFVAASLRAAFMRGGVACVFVL
ncbi:hypothetical protein BD414DRAFT_224382 [Trametes punicea]|nr:hypothetical protein BD414DRAFT_224382 [Trametes punicea]